MAPEAPPAGRRSPAFFPGGQSRPFVPDVFTGILAISQGFSELLGGGRRPKCRPASRTLPEAAPNSLAHIGEEIGLHPACKPYMDIRNAPGEQGEVPIFGQEPGLDPRDSIR